MKYLVSFLVILVFASIVGGCCVSYDRIESTSTGMKVSRYGDNKGAKGIEQVSGAVWSFPSWSYEVYSVENIIREGTFKRLTVTTKDRMGVVVAFTATYQVEPHNSIPVFIKYRRYINKEEGKLELAPLVGRFIFQAASDAANKYGAEEMVTRKIEYLTDVTKLVKERMSREGIKVDQVMLAADPDLPEGIKGSILSKIQAESDARTEVSKWLQKKAKASGDSIEAVGAANVTKIQADADANAIRKIADQLSPTYVRYLEAQKWDGVRSTTVLGSGTDVMLNK